MYGHEQIAQKDAHSECYQRYRNLKDYKSLNLNQGMNVSKHDKHKAVVNDKYGSIFENRKQIQIQKEYFKIAAPVKKDKDMERYSVTNNYDYAILKIQKWWRKRNFVQCVENYILASKAMREGALKNFKSTGSSCIPCI